jgi:hypothetical protein
MTIQEQSMEQAFSAYLMAAAIEQCNNKSFGFEDDALAAFQGYVSNGLSKVTEPGLSMEQRHAIEIKLIVFVQKMIATQIDSNLFSDKISMETFNSVRSLFCPGFFPFC